jgi:hypothetical protein
MFYTDGCSYMKSVQFCQLCHVIMRCDRLNYHPLPCDRLNWNMLLNQWEDRKFTWNIIKTIILIIVIRAIRGSDDVIVWITSAYVSGLYHLYYWWSRILSFRIGVVYSIQNVVKFVNCEWLVVFPWYSRPFRHKNGDRKL